jgi:hypothetical protein
LDGPVVRVVGVPYHGTKYDLDRFFSIKKGREDYLVVVAHLLASPAGGTMYEKEDILQYGSLVSHDADVFCFGHWHRNQGVREISSGKWVVNIGSLSRGSLSEDDVKRTPSVAVLRFQVNRVLIAERPLQVLPADQIFDLEGRERQEGRRKSVDQFVAHLKDVLTSVERKSLMDDVREALGIPDVVRERALLYLEASEVE